MNVVGRVGSLISQGVYSVATPFHPFGGAVDVIVVQQQDGTFRSTPWYVRFGKFQGVLKGAEKIVRISVNGVEANFHMYLDNSGEAYFVNEVDAGQGSETNEVVKDSDNLEVTGGDTSIGDNSKGSGNIVNIHRLEHSVSDTGVVRLQEESVSLHADRIERIESDAERGFYDFQDDQSSLDGTVELSEYGSNQFESLDGQNIVEPQNLDSEVILVCVDGHVLTAPIPASEQNTENVQLSTPQFHLGPVEGTEFCEGHEEFSSGENGWANDYFSKLGASASTANVVSDDVCSISNNDNASGHQLEVCDGEEAHVCQSQETPNTADQGGEIRIQRDSEVVSASIKREDIFMSCLELPELTKQVGNSNLKVVVSSLDAQNSQDISQQSSPIVDEDEDGGVVESRKDDGQSPSCNSSSPSKETSPFLQFGVEPIEENAGSAKHVRSDRKSVQSVSNGSESEEEKFTTSAAFEGIDNTPQRPAPGDECSKSELVECQTSASSEGIHTHSNLSKDIIVACIIIMGSRFVDLIEYLSYFICLTICRV